MIWPKRMVSAIDYIDEEHVWKCKSGNKLAPNPIDPKYSSTLLSCTLNASKDLTLLIKPVSSAVAESFDTDGKSLSKTFQNDIINGLPFGIDLCLDYFSASVQKDEHRMAQLDEHHFKLDFLISAGMYFDLNNYTATPFIQYVIQNEGYDESTGFTGAWKLTYSAKKESIPVQNEFIAASLGYVSQKPLTPLDARSRFDENGEIVVDETDSFVAPSDADSKGIPIVADRMNRGLVRIWSLDVDVSDTAKDTDTIIASRSTAAKTTPASDIQFVQ